jgi:hypothetical protein
MKKGDEAVIEVVEVAAPEPRFGEWMPVTVAMPDKGKNVLMRIHGRAWTKGHYKGGQSKLWYADKGNHYQTGEVDAWMPGPPL